MEKSRTLIAAENDFNERKVLDYQKIQDMNWSDKNLLKYFLNRRYNLWPMITENFVNEFAAYLQKSNLKRGLEIMSGTGILAKHLNDRGVTILPTDNYDWMIKQEHLKELAKLHNVERLVASQAIKKYEPQVDFLLVSWPPHKNRSYWWLKCWTSKPIFYIGEYPNGCTGDDYLHNNVHWGFVEGVTLNNWDGLYDDLHIGYKSLELTNTDTLNPGTI